MYGFICSLLAGIFMSIQGVFNTRLSGKIGPWETGVIVQGTGLALTLLVLFFSHSGNYKKLGEVNKFYLLGGVIGVLIVFTVIQGIKTLGPTTSIAIILIAQLLAASIIDGFGLFDTKHIPFSFTKVLGIIIMIIGIVILKLKA